MKYEVKAEGYEGFIEYEPPNYMQRMNYTKECNFSTKTDENGLVVASEDLSANIDAHIKALEFLQKHVKKVAVTRKADSKSYKKFEELLVDADEVLQEVSMLALTRPELGKN